MLIKALCSFSGIITMIPGEVRDVTEETGRDLIRAGFAVIEGEVEIKEATSEKKKQTRMGPNRMFPNL